MRLSTPLYRAARLSRDVEALASGDPSKMVRRGKSKIVGRALDKLGFWKMLWVWRR